jgi:hypothetical protein
MGIEPTLFAWEARVLPLNDTRIGLDCRWCELLSWLCGVFCNGLCEVRLGLVGAFLDLGQECLLICLCFLNLDLDYRN